MTNYGETSANATLLLLYQVPSGTHGGLLFRRIARSMGSQIVELQDRDLSKSMQQILGKTDDKDNDVPISESPIKPATCRNDADYHLRPDDAFCVCCGFTKESFDRLLRAWKEESVSRGIQKAVATTHNMKWPLIDLFVELKREHKVTMAFLALRRTVRAIEDRICNSNVFDPPSADNPDITPIQADLTDHLQEAGEILKDIRLIESDSQLETIHQKLLDCWRVVREQ